MGIGPQIISLYSDIYQDSKIRNNNSVCEIGRQNLVITKNVDDIFIKLFKLFNKQPSKDIMKLAPKDNWGIRAKKLYESLGFEYTSIDIDNDEKNEETKSNIVMDLNFDELKKDHQNKFDLVTNFGTSEHIFNQLNFFKTMHDLTKVGGLLISEVPCMFGVNHGMFKYEPKFFTDLARSNAYEIIKLILVKNPPSLEMYQWNEKSKIPDCEDMCIISVMKKTNQNKFCIPLCGNYENKIKNEVMSRYTYNLEGNLISGDKTSHILRNINDISSVKKEVLFSEIIKRFKKKFLIN
tara:strand:- start:446 stop:1327 length:882 start_codon:yes stop_codon:yes gene_type:complete